MTIDIATACQPDWRARGYWLDTTTGTAPAVGGNTGQFYCDAVANDFHAAWLMGLIRDQNPDEYIRYKNDAQDDGIDLDEWLSIAVDGNAPGWGK